jgi:hypothetical protein
VARSARLEVDHLEGKRRISIENHILALAKAVPKIKKFATSSRQIKTQKWPKLDRDRKEEVSWRNSYRKKFQLKIFFSNTQISDRNFFQF